MTSQPQFWGRPTPREGPHVAYKNEAASNPVLRGYVLAPLAYIIRSWSLLQGVLWKLNKFDKLKDIPGLDTYTARYDPTVIPILKNVEKTLLLNQLPRPKPRANPFQFYTSADYHELYKTGNITPVQVAEYLLSVISRPDRESHPGKFAVAFIETRAELVLDAARASTERYAKGEYLSALDGVPVAVKDEIEVQGYSKTQGSLITFSTPQKETGWCARKWQEAGAVIIGKTNMHEIGMDTNGFNATWGTPLNPHNEEYYTGGSSSGSACTVAQGICPISLGADGGGSIRIPASFCGLYGLKPSHSRLSGRPTSDLASSVGVYGPIASNLDDLALAYRIMAQPDEKAGASGMFAGPLTEVLLQPTSQRVVGVDRDWIARSDPVVLDMFETAMSHYSKVYGYEIVDISLPYLPEGQKAHAMTILSEVVAGITPAQMPQLSYQNQVLLAAAGSQASAQDLLAAQRLRNLLMQHLAWLWDRYPGMLILTPTTPCAGWKIGHPGDVAWRSFGVSDSNTSLRSMEYIYVANWTGVPALTMPMGYTEEHVPVGLMAMGEWGSEEQLLMWAKQGEELLGNGSVRRPPSEENWLDVLEIVQHK